MAKAQMPNGQHLSSKVRIELGDAEVEVVFRDRSLGVELWKVASHGRLWTAFHETYTFCQPYLQRDEQAWTYRRRRYAADTATTMLIEPGEIHRTLRGGEAGFHLLYVDPRSAAQISPKGPIHFREGQTRSPLVRARFLCFCRVAESGDALGLDGEETLFGFLQSAAEACSETGRASPPLGCPSALRRVRELMNDRYDERLSLEQVANVAGLSRYHLLRVFQREVGVPIHRYQTLIRLAKSRQLLLSGKTISEAATDVGFYDQPHFHQAFVRTYGLTPGAFVGHRASRRPLPGMGSDRRRR